MDYRDVIKNFEPKLCDFYRVKIHVNRLVGGIPKDPAMVEKWVAATCKKASDEERARIVQTHLEDLPKVTDDTIKYNGTKFSGENTPKGLFIESRQVKSMLKESGNIMKFSVPNSKKDDELGIPCLKNKVGDHVFVEEDEIYLDRQKPDRILQRPISIKNGPRGPVSAIKVSDICDNVDITFTLRRLLKGEVPEKVLYLILHYGENLGVGADRSQGFGKFKVMDVQKLSLEQAREILDRGFTPSWLNKVA
jgi:hypothetical protein